MIGNGADEPSETGPSRFPLLLTDNDRGEGMTMARPTPPGKRTRISVLDAVVVIGVVLAINGYNRLAISRLAHSLPNVNSQIVGEWKSTRGPEHLVFRTDKTVSMTVAANSARGNAAPAAPETGSPAPAAPETGSPAPAAPETNGPAPVTG